MEFEEYRLTTSQRWIFPAFRLFAEPIPSFDQSVDECSKCPHINYMFLKIYFEFVFPNCSSSAPLRNPSFDSIHQTPETINSRFSNIHLCNDRIIEKARPPCPCRRKSYSSPNFHQSAIPHFSTTKQPQTLNPPVPLSQ
jgi:hypothetical protein